MKHMYLPISCKHVGNCLWGLLLLWAILPTKLLAQTTLAPGDLVFLGYNGSDDQGFSGSGQAITSGSNVNDKFAFILLKDVTANTKIYFTDYGWLTGGGFQNAWQSGPSNNGSGTGSKDDGILSWTTSASLAAGTQVVIRSKYNIGASVGTVAAAENVSGQTYPMNLADTDNDQLFAYQATSTRATPTLLAGVMYGDSWSSSLTTSEYTSAKSTLPSVLTSSISGSLNLPSTSTIFNTYALGIYNCSTTVGFPKTLRNSIMSSANWKDYVSTTSYPGYGIVEGFLYNTDPDFLTQVPTGWDVPIGCTFTVLKVLITAQPVSKTVCSNQPASFSITAQNAQTYKWQISDDGSTNWTDISNGAVYSGANSTTLTVTNPAGLNGKYYRGVAMEPVEPSIVPSNAAQLTVNTIPQALVLTSSGPITCTTLTAQLTTSSSSTGLTYAFGGPSGAISTGPGIVTVTANQAGLYSVTATTAQSCTASTNVTVIENKTAPTSVNLSTSGPITCTATSVTLTASASATSTVNYTFKGPQGAISGNGATAVVSLAGTYTVTATASGNGCSATAVTAVNSATATVSAINPATSTATVNAAFSQTATASGGASPYSFSIASGSLPSGLNLASNGVISGTPTQSGSFSITVRAADANGCTGVGNTYVLVVGNATPTIGNFTANPDPVCQGKATVFSATIGNVTGTYGYTLTNGSLTTTGSSTATAFTQSLTTVVAGVQTFTLVVSSNGQLAMDTYDLSVSGLPSLTLTASNGGTLTCGQTSLTLSIGETEFAVFSGPGIVSQDGGNGIAVVNAAGVYSVTVTNIETGCLSTSSTTVSSNTTAPSVSINPISATLTCASPAVSLTAVGTGTYKWSTGATTQVISVTTAATYSVTLTSVNGCTATASVIVSGQAPPTVSITPSSYTLTNASPTVSLTAVGTGTYKWSTGATTQVISVTTSGTYSVTLTSPGGCTSSASVGVSGSDLTVTLDLPQANFAASGTASVGNFLVNVFEVAGLPTSSGNVRITVTAPIGYTLSFASSLTSIVVSGGSSTTVSNGEWTVTNSLASRQLTLTMNSGAFISGGGESSLGFSITRTSANSGSASSITVNVADDLTMSYDGNLSNNVYARIISGL